MDNSGYTSITINGEEIKLRFGIPAVRMFLEKISENEQLVTGETVNELGISTLIYCGYVNNCMIVDEIPSKKLGFFLEFVENAWVDDDVKNQLQHVSNVYSSSKYTKKVLENATKSIEGTKKKRMTK